jgi:hypothetical protein
MLYFPEIFYLVIITKIRIEEIEEQHILLLSTLKDYIGSLKK